MEKGSIQEQLQKYTWQPVSVEEFQALSDDEKLIRIRHSAAHLMAGAVQKFRPDTLFATGPATAEGFFYDMRFSEPLSAEDLPAIQAEMDREVEAKHKFEWTTVSKADAVELMRQTGQTLKIEIIEKIGAAELTLYRHGDFFDLCAGPHVPHTGVLKASKVLSLASAHWKKDERIPSLTRLSGTAWHNPKELRQYLDLVEEVKKRDHRVLGPQLELFSFHDWASSALWHPKGNTLRTEIQKLWREHISAQDYVEIYNPLLYRKELFECSGHWEHFQEDMFIFRNEETQDPEFILKPMNCPDTMLFYKTKRRSYRDLPFRVAEGQILHRNEATGALHGIMRTRMFTQDDAHIFLTPEQIGSEIQSLLQMLASTYRIFGLEFEARLSTRPASFMGEPAVWDRAEAALESALRDAGISFSINPGDGAFYGPKIDITILDSLGRSWQCGTVQLDFNLPERFDLTYSAEDSTLKRPVVVHRAIFGSFERFLGVIIEHFGGAFPTWLAPVQVALLPISEKHEPYIRSVAQALRSQGVRVELFLDESLNKRIRTAQTSKIPYILVAGDREEDSHSVAVRRYGSKEQKVQTVDEVTAELLSKVQTRECDVEIKDFASFFKAKKHITTESADY